MLPSCIFSFSLFFFLRSQQSSTLIAQSLSCFTLCIIMDPLKFKVGSSLSDSALCKVAEWLGRRETVLALCGKSHAALSIALFNGSIAIPTPSCMRSLFPYCYCTISYLCGCPVDVNAYSLCRQSELNSTQGGESGGGEEKDREEITKWHASRSGCGPHVALHGSWMDSAVKSTGREEVFYFLDFFFLNPMFWSRKKQKTKLSCHTP